MSNRTVPGFRFALTALVTTLAGSAATDTPPPPMATAKLDLIVHAKGFNHQGGHAIAKLFVSGQSVMGAAHATRRASIAGSDATFTFPLLQPGQYAVIVFHDENDNGIVDHGLFGHGVYGPTEPIGFSNGFRLTVISYPSFDKLKFVLSPNRNRIEVTVR